MVILSLEINKMRVNHSAVDISVTKHLHDMKNVLGSVIFHCSLPMPERVEVDSQYFWLTKICGYSSPLTEEGVSEAFV